MSKPKVGIVMGSNSDLPVMQGAAKILDKFGIDYEVKVISAHRTPDLAHKYAKTARDRGIKIIIAGAGKAAHLAGAIASLTTLPVIGVPIKTSTMGGLDSLLSTVQMPDGVPVATVAINGAKNAGLLAAQILGTNDIKIQKKLVKYKNELKSIVESKSIKVEKSRYIDQKIIKAIPHVLKSVVVDGLGKKHSGKVRDFYIKGDKRILITTDRQSAFNYNIGYVPYKGAVLNLLSKWWFEQTKKIISNHMIAVPDPNVMVVYDCKPIPVEMVVRGYMTGVTTTSIWYSYKRGERNIYGINFPDDLKKNQKLSKPVITPTTHPDPESGSHNDERLTCEQILDQKIVSRDLYKQMEKASLDLFEFGSQVCQRQGLILVDTKFEFGLYDGKLILIDELLTPDSSRFWIQDTYKERFNRGEEPENFDKEFLRLRYRKDLGYSGTGKPPEMPDDLVIDLSKRYIDVYEMITEEKFELFDYPIGKRIKQNIAEYRSKNPE